MKCQQQIPGRQENLTSRHIIIIKISSIRQKIESCNETKYNPSSGRRKRKLTDTVPEGVQTLDLMRQSLYTTVSMMLKERKESRQMMLHQIKSFNKEIEIIKWSQIGILELKITMGFHLYVLYYIKY